MEHFHVYTDSRLPGVQIRLFEAGEAKVQILEKDREITEWLAPKGINLPAYVRGLFDGMQYYRSEIPTIRLKEPPNR